MCCIYLSCILRTTLTYHIRIISTYIKGTMGELSPVVVIDGRRIGNMRRGDVTARLQIAYKEAVATRLEWSTEIPPFV